MSLRISMTPATLAFLFSILAAGCAVDTQSATEVDPDEADIQAAANVKATVAKVELKKVDRKCTIEHDFIKVSGISNAAAASINAKLERSVTALLDGNDCAVDGFETGGSQTVAYNGKGLLSVVEGGSSYYEGAAHPSHMQVTFNFDLRTGKELKLSDVLNPAGLAKLNDACKKVWETSDYCNATDANASFSIEPKGIHFFQPGAPHVVFAVGAEGQLVEWKDLRGMIKSPVVRGIAR